MIKDYSEKLCAAATVTVLCEKLKNPQ